MDLVKSSVPLMRPTFTYHIHNLMDSLSTTFPMPPSGCRQRRHQIMLTVLLFGVPLASAAESKTVLTQLPSDFVTAPWQRFQGENMFTAWEKQLLGKPAPAEGEESRPAVIKVMARARLPVRALLNTFLSEDPEEIGAPRLKGPKLIQNKIDCYFSRRPFAR